MIKLDVVLLYVFSFHNNMLCLFQLVGHVLVLMLDHNELNVDCDWIFVMVL